MITTVLAAGGSAAADTTGESDWDAGLLAGLDVPVLQGLCLTSSRAQWEASNAALAPIDAAMQVAIPEFDGRVITVPFSFKEEGPDGIPRYAADPERAARLAGIAVRHARLARTPNAAKRVAIMLSSYPTKHSRVGNAVGLDTPASAVALLRAMREAGYDLGDGFPEDGDTLIHALIAAGGHDTEWLTEDQLRAAPARVPLAAYRRFFSDLPNGLGSSIQAHWGAPPGELYTDESTGDIVLACLRFGNVVLMIQPPRGFGENPVAIYHDPDLPPSHHYLAAYRWLAGDFRADALVHLGKHGTLEWLPGKGLGLSAQCAPDAVLGDLPLVYPFIVNDPGEGTQAKRRGHAVIVDHLVPPMARADTYGEMAKLEQLLDEYATVAALDPDKLPALRAQIWSLIEAAHLHQDLGVDAQPGSAEFDNFVLHIDGYLCEVKDAAIRDGLHILGAAPSGEALVNLVLVILRAPQLWSARWGALPGLRDALTLPEAAPTSSAPSTPSATSATSAASTPSVRVETDRSRAHRARARRSHGRRRLGRNTRLRSRLPHPHRRFVCSFGCYNPRNCRQILGPGRTRARVRVRRTRSPAARDQRRDRRGTARAGWRLRTRRAIGLAHPRAGQRAADRAQLLLGRPEGHPVAHVLRDRPGPRGLADRTASRGRGGVPALRGPDRVGHLRHAHAGRRHRRGARAHRLPPALGRRLPPGHRLRDPPAGRARPPEDRRHAAHLRVLPGRVPARDRAAGRRHRRGGRLDEPQESNYLRAHALADQARHGDWRRATTRIFGSKPGAYGAGLLPLIDARNWRDDGDLAEVYAVWGGYAYGRGLDGADARPDMEGAFRRIAVAAKNIDTREHDIADSDDYFQYHGGMIAMVRSLTGRNPAAYIGDSAVPDAPKTRTLAEETRRVFRSRVVNPRWISAMRRHGYKGAFELAATVDYLFGYDATAGVVPDWMYEQLAASYVFDEETRAFMEQSNPWALRGITERLLEAASRGLWEAPDAKTLDQLRQVYLDMEGDLESRGTEES